MEDEGLRPLRTALHLTPSAGDPATSIKSRRYRRLSKPGQDTGVLVAKRPEAPSPATAPARDPRRVFFLLDSLHVGGTESQAIEIARRLAADGRYCVTLGCLRAKGPLGERLNGSRVTLGEFYPEGGIDSARGVYQMMRLAVFLRRGKFDIFHSHDLWSNLMGVPAAWLAGVPVIVSSQRDLGHLPWYGTGKRRWLRRVQRASTAVLANSAAVRGCLIADGLPAAKIRVIHNGLDIDRFARGRADRGILFPGFQDAKIIVLVGNMHSDVKGHPALIHAAPAILQQIPSALFVLAGDGAQRERFEEQARALGVSHRFVFLGLRDDIAKILASCDMAVLPSKAEGFSNALLEYMAAGLPVVATRVGGNSEIIEDNETGLLVPPEDGPSLAAAVIRLLSDSDLAGRLALNARDRVRSDFTIDRLIFDIDRLYGRLLAQAEATA
jgi:L-malate glycosyltransferase